LSVQRNLLFVSSVGHMTGVSYTTYCTHAQVSRKLRAMSNRVFTHADKQKTALDCAAGDVGARTLASPGFPISLDQQANRLFVIGQADFSFPFGSIVCWTLTPAVAMPVLVVPA
jgi:hypothetical protein